MPKLGLPGLLIGLLLAGCTHTRPVEGPLFSFGVIADVQYADVPTRGNRHYRASVEKLEAAVAHLNTLDLAFTVHLGDFIEQDWESYAVVSPLYDRLSMPRYHVLGNHEYAVADQYKDSVQVRLGMPARYYDFEQHGWRFVVLDGNDISLIASKKSSAARAEAEAYYKDRQVQTARWNGAMGAGQLAWLEATLARAEADGEPVVLFSHFPVYPENNHNLWNAAEVLQIIDGFSHVKAYLNGHNHEGHYAERAGLHYLTFKAMVNTEATAYAVVHVYPDRLEIDGQGREEDRILGL